MTINILFYLLAIVKLGWKCLVIQGGDVIRALSCLNCFVPLQNLKHIVWNIFWCSLRIFRHFLQFLKNNISPPFLKSPQFPIFTILSIITQKLESLPSFSQIKISPSPLSKGVSNYDLPLQCVTKKIETNFLILMIFARHHSLQMMQHS